MFCLSNLSINKPVVANAALPPKSSHSSSSSSSSSPEQQTNAPKPTTKTITSLPRNKLRRGPPPPTVIQIERIVGAGSFRDGDPDTGDTDDVRKSVFDLFLGQALEGSVEKKMRKTGEWLSTNAETRFRSNGKRIMMFMFQWMIPIWGIAFLVACGAIKLPFSSPFLDDLLM